MSALLVASALAAPPPVRAGYVIGGYDPVAYFTNPACNYTASFTGCDGVAGSTAFSHTYANYTFLFATDAHRQQFISNPAQYTPAWGGFCAWGIAREGCDHQRAGVPCEPEWPWTTSHMGPPFGPDGCVILRGRLMCAIDNDFIVKFLGETEDVVGDADARWTAWYGGLDKGPLNSGCFQGPTTHECKNDGKFFPNRTSS